VAAQLVGSRVVLSSTELVRYLILAAALNTRVYSVSNRNDYQKNNN
jgi:hypothetical protein